MRTFVLRLRRMLESHVELDERLDQPERKYDDQFRVLFEAIRELMRPEGKKKGRLGVRWRMNWQRIGDWKEIELSMLSPEFANECIDCGACVPWCPVDAIEKIEE